MEQKLFSKIYQTNPLTKNKTPQTSTFIISVHFCGFPLFNLVTPSQLLSFPFLPTPRITLNKREFKLLLCRLFTRNQCQCGCIFLSMRHITAAQQRLAIKLKFSMWKENSKNNIVWHQSFDNKYQLPRRALIRGCSSVVEHVLGVLVQSPTTK